MLDSAVACEDNEDEGDKLGSPQRGLFGSAGVPTRPLGIPETAHRPAPEYHQLPNL
jgi:hypothetical protein